ncbi:MAG: c-type cytochrome biogenesis protein CcsB, partial [Mariniphaga sp.]|nr:c-type cytochrome biogenesis protein CcsB [Mariniphaga sp.]
ERIFPYYLLFGFLLLVVLLANIFRQKPLPVFLRKSFYFAIVLLFVVHTAGIIIRWYISGRAPWSNGYESVVYVAWAAMLAGILFGRKYPMVIATAAFLSGVSLFVAHLNWMNPEITPLVPVLKSYWLTIHVSIITASYGFFGLSAFLGILVLILIIIRRNSNEGKVNRFIDQLTTINEMSVTVGLYFLTIGTFLGGVWANESWGRYWGWDPKETWALITIMIYSFIAHMRLIPSLKGVYNYNMASVFGFASVLMTYFGVNYFLAGLHSYGKGVADGVHPSVIITFGVIGGLMIWAYLKDMKYENSRK